jgi:hypothetical protein
MATTRLFYTYDDDKWFRVGPTLEARALGPLAARTQDSCEVTSIEQLTFEACFALLAAGQPLDTPCFANYPELRHFHAAHLS